MNVKPEPLKSVHESHALGWLDPDIAHYVYLATQPAMLTERLIAQATTDFGLEARWRERENSPDDLCAIGLKTTTLRPNGSCYFRQSNQRTSFFGPSSNSEDYHQDYQVNALVALYPDDREVAKTVMSDTLLSRNWPYETHENQYDWRLLTSKATAHV